MKLRSVFLASFQAWMSMRHLREQERRVVHDFLVRRGLGELDEHRDRVALASQVAVGVGEVVAGERAVRGVVLVAERLLERLRRLVPAPDAHVVEALVVRAIDSSPRARSTASVKTASSVLVSGSLFKRVELLDHLGALALPDELVEARRARLGLGAILVALLRVFELAREPVDRLARLLGLGANGVDARVPGELQGDEDDQHEHDVRGGAVPDQAPLVALLALGDALQVGRERVGQVVGLDDEAARLDDLALDLAELVIEFVDHRCPRK